MDDDDVNAQYRSILKSSIDRPTTAGGGTL